MLNPEYGAVKCPSTLEPPANGTTDGQNIPYHQKGAKKRRNLTHGNFILRTYPSNDGNFLCVLWCNNSNGLCCAM
jgi:hypothetical protein